MTVCKFWTQGNCKFGDQCKFEHPSSSGQQGNNRSRQPQINQSQNRFDLASRISGPNQPPAGPRSSSGRSPARDPRDARNQQQIFGITSDIIRSDLTVERPIWMMSGYGPGRNAPIQLFGGPEIEQSPEEIRCLHYQALAANNIQESAQLEARLAETATQQVNAVLNDLNGALSYLENGLNQHPNRVEVCESNTTHTKPNGPFSIQTRGYQYREEQKAQRNQAGPTGFGQQQNSGFGAKPAVGGPGSNPGFGGGFGQAGFGQQPTPTPAMNGGFGQQPQTGFGSQIVQQPQPNGFGSQPQGFGQASMQTGMGGFAQQPAQTNNTPFGQPPQPQPPSLFGQPPGSQPNGMFGQQPPQQGQSPFGQSFAQAQNSNPGNSGFGGHRPDNVMNDSAAMTSPPPSNPAVMNGISQPVAPPPSQQQTTTTTASATTPSADITTYSTRNGNTLQSWKGRPVQYTEGGVPCYQRPDGGMERIWFPNGPPQPTQATSMADVEFVEPTLGAYGFLKQNGTFRDESVPEVAPSLDMLRWDL